MASGAGLIAYSQQYWHLIQKSDLQVSVDKLQSDFRPVETGDEFLDNLLKDWHGFAFDWTRELVGAVEGEASELSEEHRDRQSASELPEDLAPRLSELSSDLEPVSVGDPMFDELIADWWEFSAGLLREAQKAIDSVKERIEAVHENSP